MKRAVFFVMALQSAFLMTACGGGGGGSASAQAFGGEIEITGVQQISSAVDTFGDVLGQVGSDFADETVKSTGDNIVFQTSDAAITTVVLDRVENASDRTMSDFTITWETALSIARIEASVIENGAPGFIEFNDDNERLYFTGALFPDTTDWLYAAAWLYTPTGSDQVTLIAIAGSDDPFPAADLGALTVVARYGSRGVAGGDTNDLGNAEAIGFYAGPEGTVEPFVANALLEANFVTDRINGVIESITSEDRAYNFELNLESANIQNMVAGGFFEGNTNVQGGSIDDWTGNWGGKFHGKVREVLSSSLIMFESVAQRAALRAYFNSMRNAPSIVLGTFGARDPDDTSQSIIGFFASDYNICTLRRDSSLPADVADSGIVICPTL